MQKLVSFCAVVSAAFLLGNNSALATATVNLTGPNTSAVLLTTKTEVFTLAAGGSLTVPDPGPAITINSGNTSPVTATLSNLGTIEQQGSASSDYAIYEPNGSTTLTITNGSTTNSTATIQADGSDALHFSKSSDNVTVNNYGQIVSLTGGQGIDTSGMTSGSGTVTISNYGSGIIEGGANDALQTAVNAKVYNDGEIVGLGSKSDGIDDGTNSGVVIVNAGAISGDTTTGTSAGSIIGGHHGITGGQDVDTKDIGSTYGQTFTMSITNNTGGVIQGNDGSGINIDGVNNKELVTVVNSGTITGNGVTGDGDGVDVDGLVNITNNANALIQSKNADGDISEGVTVGGGTIVNSGTIEGSTTGTSDEARGITLAGVDNVTTNGVKSDVAINSIYANSTITNNSGGLIKGDTESGIAVLGTTGGGFTVTINNNAGGTIEGNNTGASERGTGVTSGSSLNQAAIELDDTGNTYVINESGTITQDATSTGTAIAMHGVSTTGIANTLNITGGTASITGDISGDTAADSTLNISPGAGNSFSYGYGVSNFTVNINYDPVAQKATTGTVTFSGASTNTGTVTVAGGTFNVTNTTGSATGAGKVAVSASATFGGTGIIAPGAGNGVTLAAQSTIVSGGAQSGTTAGTGLTLDNRVAQGVILDASLGNATLAFTTGANHSATTMTVLGNTVAELKFASTDVFALTDLDHDALTSFDINTPYVLIQAGTVAGLLADNDLYSGLATTGGTDLSGNILNGYVTTPVGITLNGVNETGKLQLYLNDGALEVVPEPGTWAMMLGGLGVLVLVLVLAQLRRRKAQI